MDKDTLKQLDIIALTEKVSSGKASKVRLGYTAL